MDLVTDEPVPVQPHAEGRAPPAYPHAAERDGLISVQLNSEERGRDDALEDVSILMPSLAPGSEIKDLRLVPDDADIVAKVRIAELVDFGHAVPDTLSELVSEELWIRFVTEFTSKELHILEGDEESSTSSVFGFFAGPSYRQKLHNLKRTLNLIIIKYRSGFDECSLRVLCSYRDRIMYFVRLLPTEEEEDEEEGEPGDDPSGAEGPGDDPYAIEAEDQEFEIPDPGDD
ncbi:MAG: hypothetical protein ACYCPS_06930 [Candidatus Saccharimonadales bacterium]